MRFITAFVGVFLVVSLCEAAVVQRRTYRNTEEILVPVTIIQDAEEIKESSDVKENETAPQIKNLAEEAIAEDIVATAVDEEQKLEVVEAVVEAQRRLDEAIVEEEIKEAVQEEQDKEIIKAIEEENKLRTAIPEVPQIVAVLQPEEASEAIEQLAPQVIEEEIEKSSDLKSVVVEKETPNRVVVILETNNDESEQAESAVRQATQATPTQTTTQQNFVQQLIQNSPLGQFFNQITGQTTQGQVANDDPAPAAPAPTLPGLFNPVTAVQNAAQSVVNSTTQAFQGLQQFASNLGNQFQNTLSGIGGQPQEQGANDATTARPPGPIQQLVNTFMGNNGQQPAPTQQGPLQGLLNIFQGNNRPQGATAAATVTNPEPLPAKEPEPEISEQVQTIANDAIISPDQISNEVRDSAEANDSFEESVQPEELIVVNDDASPTETEQEEKQEVTK
ncbi:20-hydroxyecdysone protein [Calliphora vicina]|uniref:20-hydroxyecdysone protein n=1 Tax=Calliphora vicina TaxID=7373 RepID=UPI00325B12D6